MRKLRLYKGDCLQVLETLAENSIDAVVTDPPYHFTSGGKGGFMGKAWDGGDIAFRPETWRKVMRVLKPGGHLVAFGATKNYHRLACAIEDAGFEIRDCISNLHEGPLLWVQGQGFPKSQDISKAIDKSGGVNVTEFKRSLREYVERSGKSRAEIDALCGFTMRFDTTQESDPTGWGCSLPSPDKWLKICDVLGCDPDEYAELVDRVWRGRSTKVSSENGSMSGANYERKDKGSPIFDAAKQWSGWGTSLKPSVELICMGRKPLSEGTVAANVLRWSTGGINIDATRIAATNNDDYGRSAANAKGTVNAHDGFEGKSFKIKERDAEYASPLGRWPANLCLTLPEDEYELRGDVSESDLLEIEEWLNAHR